MRVVGGVMDEKFLVAVITEMKISLDRMRDRMNEMNAHMKQLTADALFYRDMNEILKKECRDYRDQLQGKGDAAHGSGVLRADDP